MGTGLMPVLSNCSGPGTAVRHLLCFMVKENKRISESHAMSISDRLGLARLIDRIHGFGLRKGRWSSSLAVAARHSLQGSFGPLRTASGT